MTRYSFLNSSNGWVASPATVEFSPPPGMTSSGKPEVSPRYRRVDYWAAAARDCAAAAGRFALRKVRMWRTASGILSGVSFHG